MSLAFVPIREILMLLALVNLAAMPLTVLLPVFATDVLHGGPDTLGLLTAAMGLGALLGALSLASRKSVLGLGRQIAWASAVFGLSLIAFSFSRVLWLSMLLLVTQRLCRDDGNGGQQHHPANHRGRRQTRPGDELLRDGFPWRGSVGKPVGRQSGQPHWGGPRRATRRNHVYHGFVGLRLAFACPAEDHPADLSADRDSAGCDGRDSV